MVITKKKIISHHVFKLSSFLIALIVAIWPVPFSFAHFRPEFVCILVIYWTLHTPLNTGLVYVWCVGLVQDIMENTTWGAHALALTLIAFVCLSSYRRMRSFSIWQQSLWVFILVGAHQVIVSWILSLSNHPSKVSFLVVPEVVSALLWPILNAVLYRLRYEYRTHFR